MGWQEQRDAVLAEIDALVHTVQGLPSDDWARPTTCGGWTAADAAAHVAGSIGNQERAFANMLAGSQETPEWVEGTHSSPEATLAAFTANQAAMVTTLGQLDDRHVDQSVPLPIGTFPLPVALDIVLLEYGVHHWDVAHACDPSATLSPAVATAVFGLMPAFMTFFAAEPPPEPIAYRLEGTTATIHASTRDGAWTLEPATTGDITVIRGDDAAIALFALGRITGDDSRLQVEGDGAPMFKTWFPGP